MAEKRLAAIMFTDIVGYTALMGKDSTRAMELLRSSKEIQKPLVEKHNGKWLKEMGDGVMASFNTAIEAVTCAIEIQEQARAKFDSKYRIGIHSGDITIENDDVYGDGVNVASRLESLADPGGIYISESIEKAIRGQSIKTLDLGEFTLKNVDYQVKAYAVQGVGLPLPQKRTVKKNTVRRGYSLGIAVFLIAAIAISYYLYTGSNSTPDTVISDKSIAVLPFVNMSGDPEQDYFSDGMMEEILNHLYKIGDLLVSSRTSSMRYRGSSKSIPEIAEELGVATVLEGSVRKSGNQVRITVQLIDGKTDKHLWSETFDRSLDDIFTIQSEVAQSIAATLQAEIQPEVRLRIESQPTSNTEAYNLFLESNRLSVFIESENKQALQMLEEVIQLDPTFGRAYLMVGFRLQAGATFLAIEGGVDPVKTWIISKPYFEKALELDPGNGTAHVRMAWSFLWFEWDFEAAAQEYEKAKELLPNYSWTDYLVATGNFEEAAAGAEKSMEIDPTDGLAWSSIITSQYFAGKHKLVVKNIQTVLKDSLQMRSILTLTESSRVYMYLGRHEEALDIIAMINKYWPDLESPRIMAIEAISQYHVGNTSRVSEIIERLIEKSADNAGGSPSYFLGMIYSEMGETDQAFDWLEKGYQTREVEMYWLKVEPPFKPFHNDPRWQVMLDKVGFPE